MKKSLLILFIILCAGFTAFAIESSKPDTHTTAWSVMHGKQARVTDRECLTCHTERLECIQCHEDVKPRTHNATWTMKGHGLESRWNTNSCRTCHTEEFCTECHETSIPVNHRPNGFGPSTWGIDQNNRNSHCMTSCQLPMVTGNWKTTMAKDCLVCHKTRPTAAHAS